MRIIFYASSENERDKPQPSGNFLPDYYRSIPPPSRTQPTFSDEGFVSNVRACVPFQDALSAGYTQRTWSDLYITVTAERIDYRYCDDSAPLMLHREMHPSLASAWDGFLPIEFAWLSRWQVQTPPGYSALITHPLNRHDLPFVTLSGIIDSDRYTNDGSGRIPFYLRKGFSGLIPAGTPMYQVIPIRRDDWKAEFRGFDDKRRPRQQARRYFTGAYRRLFWQRKSYS